VIDYQRALEALRNGVPNRDAVRVLGSNQAGIHRQPSSFTETVWTVKFPKGYPSGRLYESPPPSFRAGKECKMELGKNPAKGLLSN
jgi:hypothetical protein